ncbi:pentapeptide repeat-containing protein [Shewanella surugensis]|uniref:Pentapeptide repeat-containing protein n=1 Tax=Shewanella surugensis TaxID=212020 RepID=A0ABT0LFY4_9GAMM|nr:pentapeptide repeat-containing protein [Shewanella surugensis]MCL1126252.1 pentapeptide repeat-containing protein [Shewanella surugensis]
MIESENIEGRWVNNGEYFECIFDNVNVSPQHFSGMEFEECTFNDCDFNEATFKHCRFIHCHFNRCQMSVIKWLYTELFDVKFIECKLVGVDWTQADWPTFRLVPELIFKQCMLNGGSFFGLTLHEVVLDECKLHDVDFREGDFKHSKMINCDLSQSLFIRTQLQQVDFTDSVHFDINILNNSLTKATFSRLEAMSLLQGLDITLVD